MKPLHAKPNLYAYYFEVLKEIAKEYGYNLVVHGSMNRDLDLIAIPWAEKIKPHLKMVKEFAKIIGGAIMTKDTGELFSEKPHGRINYIININRDLEMTYEGFGKTKIKDHADPQTYIDISITPVVI